MSSHGCELRSACACVMIISLWQGICVFFLSVCVYKCTAGTLKPAGAAVKRGPTRRADNPTRGDIVDNPGVHRILTGPNLAPLGELVRRFKHLHQEGVDGRVTNQFKEEQVLQALQTNGAQCWEPQKELCKPRWQWEGWEGQQSEKSSINHVNWKQARK